MIFLFHAIFKSTSGNDKELVAVFGNSLIKKFASHESDMVGGRNWILQGNHADNTNFELSDSFYTMVDFANNPSMTMKWLDKPSSKKAKEAAVEECYSNIDLETQVIGLHTSPHISKNI